MGIAWTGSPRHSRRRHWRPDFALLPGGHVERTIPEGSPLEARLAEALNRGTDPLKRECLRLDLYESRRVALGALRRIRRERGWWRHLLWRTHRCFCGWWHVAPWVLPDPTVPRRRRDDY